jgi:hypothetical protein
VDARFPATKPIGRSTTAASNNISALKELLARSILVGNLSFGALRSGGGQAGTGDIGMRDFLVLAILVAGVPLVGWSLIHGLRTGTMEAAGVPFATYTRATQPFMFWLATLFNGMICLGPIALLIASGL